MPLSSTHSTLTRNLGILSIRLGCTLYAKKFWGSYVIFVADGFVVVFVAADAVVVVVVVVFVVVFVFVVLMFIK